MYSEWMCVHLWRTSHFQYWFHFIRFDRFAFTLDRFILYSVTIESAGDNRNGNDYLIFSLPMLSLSLRFRSRQWQRKLQPAIWKYSTSTYSYINIAFVGSIDGQQSAWRLRCYSVRIFVLQTFMTDTSGGWLLRMNIGQFACDKHICFIWSNL